MPKMGFALNTKKLREQNKLSQKEIADYLGVTRQAVASYESGKREPDYGTLIKLSDFYGVSVDSLLGRSQCKDINVLTIAKNIVLIKGDFNYEEFSRDIFRKTGVCILENMLKLYAEGEKIPAIGTIKVLAKYASVHESFFYKFNTLEDYANEKALYDAKTLCNEKTSYDIFSCNLDFMDPQLAGWVQDEKNMHYIMLAKEIQDTNLPLESVKSILSVLISVQTVTENSKKQNV